MRNGVLAAPNQLARVERNRMLMTETCSSVLVFTENTKKERLF